MTFTKVHPQIPTFGSTSQDAHGGTFEWLSECKQEELNTRTHLNNIYRSTLHYKQAIDKVSGSATVFGN